MICILFINWYCVKIYTITVPLLTIYIVNEYKKSMKRWNNISTFLKYNVRIWYTLNTWINKQSMCLIGHLNNCNVAFRVYVHVYYTNRVIEFSLNFPGLKKTFLILIEVSKSCSITFSDIIKQILCTNKKKILGHNYTTLIYLIVRALALKPPPLTQGLEVHNFRKKHSSS